MSNKSRTGVVLRKITDNHYSAVIKGSTFDVKRQNSLQRWTITRDGEKWGDTVASLITVRNNLAGLLKADASGGHTWDELPDF